MRKSKLVILLTIAAAMILLMLRENWDQVIALKDYPRVPVSSVSLQNESVGDTEHGYIIFSLKKSSRKEIYYSLQIDQLSPGNDSCDIKLYYKSAPDRQVLTSDAEGLFTLKYTIPKTCRYWTLNFNGRGLGTLGRDKHPL